MFNIALLYGIFLALETVKNWSVKFIFNVKVSSYDELIKKQKIASRYNKKLNEMLMEVFKSGIS